MTDKEKLDKIHVAIKIAEQYCDMQIMPESMVCMAALKDIRNVINAKSA